MRAIFSILGLVVVLAIVGVTARKQLGAVTPTSAPAAVSDSEPVTTPVATPQQQVEQFKQAIDASMQPRAMPDDQE